MRCPPARVSGALVTVAVCALIGARLYHVIDQWAFYATDLLAIVLPPYSGLGLYGGIAGAIVGIARIRLGTHWPSDVIAGAMLGMAWLAVVIAAVKVALPRGR